DRLLAADEGAADRLALAGRIDLPRLAGLERQLEEAQRRRDDPAGAAEAVDAVLEDGDLLGDGAIAARQLQDEGVHLHRPLLRLVLRLDLLLVGDGLLFLDE